MKLPLLSATMSVLFLLAAGSSFDASAAPSSTVATVVAKTTYQPGSSEAAYITGWISRNSPAYSPMNSLGNVTVRHTYSDSGRVVRSGVGGPPVPLPTNGYEGEEITITSRQPDGTTETWAYTWTSGKWKIVEYHFKDPNETSEPPPLGG